MPIPVPQLPTAAQLRRLLVGRVASHQHVMRWTDELLYLLGYNLPTVASVVLPEYTHASNDSVVQLYYYPSPYAKALRATAEVYSTNAPATCEIETLVDGVSATFLAGYEGGLDISKAFRMMYDRRQGVSATGYIDVSGLSAAPHRITVTRLADVGDTGIRRVSLCEVPLAASDVETTPADEPGVNPAWALPPGRIVEALSTNAYGFARIVGQLDAARTLVRRHVQVATLEDTTNAEQTASASFVTIFGATGTLYRLRGSRIWGTAASSSTDEPFYVFVRYLAASGATLRLAVTPVGGATVNTDIALGASAAWATDASGTLAIPVQVAGVAAECDVEIQLKATAGTAYVATVALVAAQT
jgi:hypothetical protein